MGIENTFMNLGFYQFGKLQDISVVDFVFGYEDWFLHRDIKLKEVLFH